MPPLQGAQVWSLVRKLESHKPCGVVKKKKFCCCFFKDKRYVSERSKHLSENVLILNLHWECPSCERSCQGYVRRTHRTPAPPTPDQGWGKGLLMKISPWVGASNVFKEKNPGFVLMIRGKEKTRECPSESVRESTHLEKLVEWRSKHLALLYNWACKE